MPETLDPLTHELLLWIATRPRTYPEAMEAWRSNCPRHTIWEDALIAGFVQVVRAAGPNGSRVALTSRGRTALADGAAA